MPNRKNDSHYIELLAACAALDFYNTKPEQLEENKKHAATDYLYRAVGESGRFEFEDFVGQQRAEEFARKFGTLLAFALFCNGEDDFVESVRCGAQKEITEFTGMEVSQVEYLKSTLLCSSSNVAKDNSPRDGCDNCTVRPAVATNSSSTRAFLVSTRSRI